jgi:hypothetical protein
MSAYQSYADFANGRGISSVFSRGYRPHVVESYEMRGLRLPGNQAISSTLRALAARSPTATLSSGASSALRSVGLNSGASSAARVVARGGAGVLARIASIPYVGIALAAVAAAALIGYGIYRLVSWATSKDELVVNKESSDPPVQPISNVESGPKPGGGVVIPRRPGQVGVFNPTLVIEGFLARQGLRKFC